MSILYRKELIDHILDAATYDYVKLITGLRWVGKTTLLKSMIVELEKRGVNPDNIFYFSLFSSSFYKKDFLEVYKEINSKFEGLEGKIYLFFDDVEAFNHWQQLIDSYRTKDGFEVYAAVNYSQFHNSSSHVLSGRTRNFELYPFSFKEFVEYKKELCCSEKSLQELFLEYVRFGGMPGVVSQSDITLKYHFLENLMKGVGQADLAKNTGFDRFLVEMFLEYMVLTFTQKFSRKRINRELYDMFDDETLSGLKYYLAESSFMSVSEVAYDGRQWNWDEKYYLIDHGFFNQLNGFYSLEMHDILKNIIYVELLRRGYKVFFTESREKYVDFICWNYNRRIYIQFDLSFASESIIQREIASLKYHAGGHDKYIITAGDYDFSGYGVKHINIIDFLLGDEI